MPPKNFKTLSEKEQTDFLKNIDTVLTDCDGVLWIGKEVIPGADDVYNYWQDVGKKVVYISNNSTRTVPEYLNKFNRLGFKAQLENIIVAAPMAARYVSQNMDKTKKAYVIGYEAIITELNHFGIEGFGIGDDPAIPALSDGESLSQVKLEDNVGAVIIGYEEYFNYTKMVKASSYLNNSDCLFVATNRDNQFPVSNKQYTLPGTGTMVAALEYCLAKKAVCVGKPSTFLTNYVNSKHNLDPKRTIMIGDRCNSDMIFGNTSGYTTLFVLTGTHSLKDVERYENSTAPEDKLAVPKYYIDSVGDLLPYLKKAFEL